MSTFWEEETPATWQDALLVLLLSCMWPLARLLLDWKVFQNLGRFVLFRNGKKSLNKEEAETKEKTLVKFTESCWKLTYYIILEVYVLFITKDEPWALNTAAFWEGWPSQTVKYKLKLYYIGQCAFYIYSVAALLFWETRRKDFSVMMTHHIVTIGLVGYSYTTGNFRVGSVVLALHDISDVFMEAAKLFKYGENEFIASALFGLFAISWFLLRLIYFPFWIIWSTSVECLRYIDLSRPDWHLQYYTFNTLLITLLVIHFYWWILIFRMIVRQLKNSGRVGDDVRSDSEDD